MKYYLWRENVTLERSQAFTLHGSMCVLSIIRKLLAHCFYTCISSFLQPLDWPLEAPKCGAVQITLPSVTTWRRDPATKPALGCARRVVNPSNWCWLKPRPQLQKFASHPPPIPLISVSGSAEWTYSKSKGTIYTLTWALETHGNACSTGFES